MNLCLVLFATFFLSIHTTTICDQFSMIYFQKGVSDSELRSSKELRKSDTDLIRKMYNCPGKLVMHAQIQCLRFNTVF